MANGTLKVQNIETSSGSGTITLGQSGETLALGATTNNLLTPAFQVSLSANQTGIADASNTKIQFNTEEFDTDNAYDNSTNYRFTVPSGKAGRYFFYLAISHDADESGNGSYNEAILSIYKNGSALIRQTSYLNQQFIGYNQSLSYTDVASVDDYYEAYIYIDNNNGNTTRVFGSEYSVFGGYRIGA